MSHARNDTATRTGAVLFTDLVGFTEFTDARGDAAAVEVLDEQSTIARDALAGGVGQVVKELGDGLMLWFDHVTQGLEAAGRIMRAVETARSERGFPLALRMGMHCGEVVERGTDFVGQTVNIASRIADLAGPGELLVSEQVVDAVGGQPPSAAFRPVGPTRVKGVTTPVWLYRLAL
jgi:class 3 adenylate cyclase